MTNDVDTASSVPAAMLIQKSAGIANNFFSTYAQSIVAI